MEQLWIYCEMCEEESSHEILKSKTSTRRGFSFQGVVQCLECNSTGHAEIKEEPPLSLKLRLSDDNETLNNTLDVDRGVLISVGQIRPYPDGFSLLALNWAINVRHRHSHRKCLSYGPRGQLMLKFVLQFTRVNPPVPSSRNLNPKKNFM